MKYAEKFYCAIALLLMSSGVVVAENKEVFSKNTHVGNATGYCITISRMDKKAFSDNKSVYYMPDGYLETTIAATTDVPRPIKLHVVFYNVSTNDSVQRCAGKKYKEKNKHFYYEFDAISLDDVP
ncbi:hypothetical protein BM451_09755 [Dickeya dadantii]|uniref:Uncharacterized protein n=1 Tax=Dickeya dadantii (strain 3937) TaxID=198628 RepID=E0SL52_DICD3|nr:hypothetical protein [Dickeya dadantii]ADM98087.1 hypothetical protein Dda3937_03429 [Dickeya dadantii 3937]OOC13748.1 hypothetical protein BM451_09755 [Dickeya dadantii]UAY97996.1 hypothetical protein KTF62_09175 [Dickeya dadantii]